MPNLPEVAASKPKRAKPAPRSAPTPLEANTAKGVGSEAYGQCGTTATAHAKPLGKSSAIYGAHMARQLAEREENDAKAQAARPKIDALIGKVRGSSGDDRRLALKALNDFLSSLGPDVVDQLRGGETHGVGYVNEQLLQIGDVYFEPVMDAASRRFVQLSKPGEIRGETGRISFQFKPYSEGTLRYLQSVGNQDKGMWSVGYDGVEAFNFRKDGRDGSISANRRDLHRSNNGGNLSEVLGGFIEMMGEQGLPKGYRFEIDLEDVPKERHADVKQSLAALAEYGAELKYLVSDAHQLVANAMESAKLGERIDKLMANPQKEWSPADWAEYREVFTLYHQQPEKRFES